MRFLTPITVFLATITYCILLLTPASLADLAESAPASYAVQSVTLGAIQDGFVNSKFPDSKLGTAKDYVIMPKASETRAYYVKFDLSSVDKVDQAILRLYNTEWNDSQTNVTFAAQAVGDNWSEEQLTWNNRPVPNDEALAAGGEANGGYSELDVSSYVQKQAAGDGIASFYIYVNTKWGTGGVWDQRVALHSRESVHPPQLRVDSQEGADTSAPTAPTNLTVSNITKTSVALSWTASSDNQGVVKYEVLKNSAWDQSVFGSPPIPSAVVTGLEPRTTYVFYVKAADAEGNVSSNSKAVTVKTAGSLDAFTKVREDNFEGYATGTKDLDYYYEQNCETGTSCGTPCSNSPLLVTDEKSRCGNHSLRFVRAYEDKVITGGSYCSARNEIGNYEDAFANYGDDVWIGFSIYIADNFLQDKWTQENVHVFQFKNIDAGGGGNQYGSIITHQVDGVFKYDLAGYGDVADVVLNQWTDIVLHLKYGINNDGVIEAWIGDQYVKKTNVDFPEKQSCYVKFGTYSDVLLESDPAHRVYYDEIKIALAPDGDDYRSSVDCSCDNPTSGRILSGKTTKNNEVTSNQPITIYPNPSRQDGFILQTNADHPVKINLYNQQGQRFLIVTQSVNDHRVTVQPAEHLPKGLYFLQWTQSDGRVQQRKVMIN